MLKIVFLWFAFCVNCDGGHDVPRWIPGSNALSWIIFDGDSGQSDTCQARLPSILMQILLFHIMYYVFRKSRTSPRLARQNTRHAGMNKSSVWQVGSRRIRQQILKAKLYFALQRQSKPWTKYPRTKRLVPCQKRRRGRWNVSQSEINEILASERSTCGVKSARP